MCSIRNKSINKKENDGINVIASMPIVSINLKQHYVYVCKRVRCETILYD